MWMWVFDAQTFKDGCGIGTRSFVFAWRPRLQTSLLLRLSKLEVRADL